MKLFTAGLIIIFLLASIGTSGAILNGNSDGRNWSPGDIDYPTNNIMRYNITALPIHAQSSAWITNLSELANRGGVVANVCYTQGLLTEAVYIVNASNVTPQRMSSTTTYYDNVAPGVPIPDDMTYVTGQSGDSPATIIDTENKIIYSLAGLTHTGEGAWTGASAIWNYSNNNYRFSAFINGTPNGNQWLGHSYVTAKDGTTLRAETLNTWGGRCMIGMPCSYMMVKYSETATGTINHALYIIVPYAGNASSVLWPGLNTGDSASQAARINCIAPGARLRLNNSFDITSAPGEAKTILQAMKTYGGIVGDNGATYGVQIYIANDSAQSRWSTSNLGWIRNHVPLSALEVVDESSLMVSRYTMEANVTTAEAPYEGGTTLTVFATNASDARMSNRTAAAQSLWLHTPGTAIDNSTKIITGVGFNSVETTNKYETLVRYGWCGDTSGIPDNATNISAKFYVKGAVGSNRKLGNLAALLVGFNPTDKTDLVAGDFDLFGVVYDTTALKLNSTWSATGWNEYTLNPAGLYNLSKTGDSCLGLMVKDDYYNTTTDISYTHYNDSVLKIYQNGTEGSSPYLNISYDLTEVISEVGFTKSKTVVRIPASIQFTDTSIGAISWNWSFGDETYSEEQSPSHTYTRAGIMTVNLTINGDESVTDRVFVTRGGGGDYQINPFTTKNPLLVNCNEFTYTVSREISYMERLKLEDKLAVLCRGLGAIP